jgi:hypothetical protein
MKNNKCPKCSGNRIIKIPGQTGAHGSGNNIPLGMTIFSAVKVTRYLCCQCGYSEEWVDSKGDIDKLEKEFKSK